MATKEAMFPKKIEINTTWQDVAKPLTIIVHLMGGERLRIGLAIIKFGCWVSGLGFEKNDEQKIDDK